MSSPFKIKSAFCSFTGNTSYFTTGTQAKSEATAVNDALTDLARRIVERTVEQW